MASPFGQWLRENTHCIRQWLAAHLRAFAKHFKHGIDGECVDVFHAASLIFFARFG
jgi:hypothetical protein